MKNTQTAGSAAPTDETPGAGNALDASWGSIFCQDALTLAPTLPYRTLDLLYMDPPFFTNRNHSAPARNLRKAATLPPSPAQNSELEPPPIPQLPITNDQLPVPPLLFTDRWAGGRATYLTWLEARIRALRPLLKPSGTFLLHLDWHAVHYAKVLCDAIFGEERFENELIWYYQTGGASKGRFSRKHDSILLYSNGPGFFFDGRAIAIPRTAKAMKRAQCPTGARIKATDTHKNPDDVLIVPALNPMANERTGYPTQKPLELLERLIRALTPPGGTVGDFFCGSGTTLLAAHRLGRRWLGADLNPAAVALAQKRLQASVSNSQSSS